MIFTKNTRAGVKKILPNLAEEHTRVWVILGEVNTGKVFTHKKNNLLGTVGVDANGYPVITRCRNGKSKLIPTNEIVRIIGLQADGGDILYSVKNYTPPKVLVKDKRVYVNDVAHDFDTTTDAMYYGKRLAGFCEKLKTAALEKVA